MRIGSLVPPQFRAYLLVASLGIIVTILSVVGIKIYNAGYSSSEAKHESARLELQEKLFSIGNKHQSLSLQNQRLKAQRAIDLQEYEDALENDASPSCTGIDPTGMRDIENLWRR